MRRFRDKVNAEIAETLRTQIKDPRRQLTTKHLSKMLTLATSHRDQILSHACTAAPDECCGLIGGENNRSRTIYPLTNVSLNPAVAYEAAPEELFAAQKQMRDRGEQLVAIYHSHPRSAEPLPSETDVKLAYYPSATYLIVGLAGAKPLLRAFEISEREQSWRPVEYELVDE
ncbi:MAG TPA: M67 family metallopeptidase [Pyrinomonadaceae bacterium]|jgi:proteasome lid subunit RPN8/RPN11